MKKNLFLTLMLALLCTATAWAQFNPKADTAYALQLVDTELYMDVETLERSPNGVDNNISLSATPTQVFFEKAQWGWSIKNSRGNYINVGSEWWNPAIQDSYNECDWIIDEPVVGVITIQYPWAKKYIGTDDPKDGGLLWCSIEEGEGKYIRFKLIEFSQFEQAYTLSVVDMPDGASIKYNGNEVTNGAELGADFDPTKLVVTCPAGYTWEVNNDAVNRTVTITFTAAAPVADLSAVVELIKRVGGDAAAEKFEFVLDAGLDTTEAFVISGNNGKIRIKGTTISAITTGIGWYLNNHAHINIAWNSLNEKTASGAAYADLSGITAPTTTERHTCDTKYRYYLNYCTFGYSMSTWDWKRWQQEIDWMALHGVNMPLQIVGLEEVWRQFLVKYNYSATEAKAFVPGPAFTAWWAMNNLEGWGGTAADGWGGVQNDAWYARQANLAKQILDCQRALGMEPVLPGFSGMVPSNFNEKTGVVCDAGDWCDFTRPKIVLPSNENFAQIAADYYACLKAVMGESQYYSMDPFHEGGEIVNGTEEQYKAAYKAIYDAMEAANSGSKWLIQQWQWNHKAPNFQAYSINAVPEGRLIVLDLFSDGRPEFDYYNGYAPQDAIYCSVPNFGGRSGLMGRLQNVTDNYFYYKDKYANLKGIAAIPEAIEQTPVAYDLLFQLPWMESKPNVTEWVKNYTVARYGVENDEIKAAWDLIRQGPLNYGADAIQGPIEDVWAARPNLDANAASSWGSTISKPSDPNSPAPEQTYTRARQQMLIDATYRLLAQDNVVKGVLYRSNYNYDIVEFGGAVMADYANYLLLGIKEAKEAAGEVFEKDPLYIVRRDAFLALIADVDGFKGTNLNFRLGKWTGQARAAAAEVQGASTADADWYEYNNARTLITTWGDYAQNNGGGLRDYSYRSWQGMLKDYYLPRWQYYFDNGCKHPGDDVRNYFYFEWNWAHGMTHEVGQTSVSKTRLAEGQPGHTAGYTLDPVGNTVDEANKLLAKYIIPVVTDNGRYYAYRHLVNDVKPVCKVMVEEGETVNFAELLSDIFGNVDGVTISGSFIESADGLANVKVKSGAANGSTANYDATITYGDNTTIIFTVVVKMPQLDIVTNPNGLYHIVYNDAPVFVAYSDRVENRLSTPGYKLFDATLDNTAENLRELHAATIDAMAPADAIFTIVPNSAATGYTLSAQGLYMQSTYHAEWASQQFGANERNAGVYLFEETGTAGIYRLKSDATSIQYVNDWGEVFGNDMSTVTSTTFTLRPVTEYILNIPESGATMLCLPFNVVLPAGVIAYDVTAVGEDANGKLVYATTELAGSGEKVKAGTPVLLKGAAGEHVLGVTIDNTDANGSLLRSVLRGNFMKQSLAPSEVVYRYTFDTGTKAFNLLGSPVEIPANSAWMELGEEIEGSIYEGVPESVQVQAEIPVAGKVYRIRNSSVKNRYMVNDGLRISLPTSVEDDDMGALWVCTAGKPDGQGQYTFVSALGTAALGWCGLAENAVGFTLGDGSVEGALALGYDGKSLAVAVEGGVASLVATGEPGNWFFEVVYDAPVAFERPFISEHHWGTLYLPYAVTIPEGVTAYYATIDGVDVSGKMLTLNKVEKIIPAATPVLLNREENMNASYRFEYTTEQSLTTIIGNIFEGRIMESLVECGNGKNYYMLLKAGKGEAFYWVFKEYDANGILYPGENKTHIKCEANKAYFAFDAQGANVAAFSFRVGEGTTEIDDVKGENGEVKAIYDLQGRKLNEITNPGIYIVNGKKVVVK